MSFTQFQLDLTKINEKPKLYICRPDKTTIGILSSYFGLKWNPKISQISQLDFSIFTEIEINHKLVRNNNYDLLKYKYLIRYEFMDYVEYFVINTIEDSSDDSLVKNVNCYSLAFNLTDEIITYSNTDTDYSKNGTQILNILLNENTIWTVGNVSADIDLQFLTFDFSEKTCLDCLYEVATAFSALLQFDTINYTVSLSNDLTSIENIDNIANSTNYGLVLDYGKYIDKIDNSPNVDNFCTYIIPYGKNGITINSVTPTGKNALTNYSYFLGSFSRDENKNVLVSSEYMSDSLASSILDFQEKILTYEGQFETLINNKIALQETLDTSDTDLVDLKTEMYVILDSLDITQSNGQDTSVLITNRNNKQIEIDNKYEEINSVSFDVTITNSCIADGSINLTIDDKVIDIPLLLGDTINTVATKINNYINNKFYNYDNKFPLTPTFKCTTINETVSIIYFTTKDEADFNVTFTDTDSTGVTCNIGDKINNGLDNQISNINNQMLVINNELSEENNFTSEQIFELKASYVKKKIIRNDFISDVKILKNWAETQFKKYYTVPTNIEISLVNLFNCLDVGCQFDRKFIKLGEIIKITYPQFNIDVKCIITEINYSLDDNNITLTISNIVDISKNIDKYLRLFNQSISTTASVNANKDNWNQISTTTNQLAAVIDTLQGNIKNDITLNVNENVEISKRGIYITSPDNPLNVLIIQNGVLAISNDGGNTWGHCISTSGIIGQKIIGKLLLGLNLEIDASDSLGNKTFIVNQNGVQIFNMIMSLMRSDNKTRILLDPTVGFSIQKNTGTVETPVWSDVLYINNDGDLVTTGNIVIGSGTNNVLHVDENGIYLGSNTFSDAPFRVNLSGDMVAESATVEGNMNVTGSLKIQGTDILDTIDNVKTINGQYLSSNSIGSSKIIDLNADKISAGTITGSTIKTGEDDNTRVELKSTFADIDLYRDSDNILRIEDDINASSIYSPVNYPITIGRENGSVYAEGDWNFVGANVTGIVARFM